MWEQIFPTQSTTLARIVAESMGKPCKIEHLEARNEVKLAFSDHSKAERVFGKRKEVSLESGIQTMAEVKTHGARASSTSLKQSKLHAICLQAGRG